jgi:hypothetical protein
MVDKILMQGFEQYGDLLAKLKSEKRSAIGCQ